MWSGSRLGVRFVLWRNGFLAWVDGVGQYLSLALRGNDAAQCVNALEQTMTLHEATNSSVPVTFRQSAQGDVHCRRHGFRLVGSDPLIERVMSTLAGGQRLEILRVLMSSSLDVSAITKAVFAKIYAVSKDLAALEICGLVKWRQIKKTRVYSLTDRVRSVRVGDMTQIGVGNGMGQWVVVHLDDTADPAMALPPPSFFVDERLLCSRCRAKLNRCSGAKQ